MNSTRIALVGALLLAIASVCHAVIDESRVAALDSLITDPELLLRARALRQRVIAQGICNPNLCFAVDGSNTVDEFGFNAQLDFVKLVTAIVAVDTSAAFSAVQYGLRNIEISPLTSDADRFLLDVEDAVFSPAPTTFIAAGLGYCVQQLRPRADDANKIVLISDGNANFGGNPVPIARRFRRRYGAICAAGIGFTDRRVLRRITGDRNLVFTLDDFTQLLDILEELVVQICGLPEEA